MWDETTGDERRVCEMIKDVRKETRCDVPSCEEKYETSMSMLNK